MGLKNVERIEEQNVHQKTWFQRFRTSAKYAVAVTAPMALMNVANAAEPAAPDTTSIVTYLGLIVVAIGVVGTAWLMAPLAAKGIKAIRAAF
ncbi:major capsid protein [Acinetobacter colistiniresistens]|uniref:major capsid protein n=1 Tax=Acinetobacter colistiniresistens TaxID=280145 RepID=UPI00124FFC56|nr:major capsid protein [Acinetobacter colistiniresistens]